MGFTHILWLFIPYFEVCPLFCWHHADEGWIETKEIICAPPGQFLLEQSRPKEAAEMAERAAELDMDEFDVVFNAAHMLRSAAAARKHSNNWGVSPPSMNGNMFPEMSWNSISVANSFSSYGFIPMLCFYGVISKWKSYDKHRL